MFNIPKCYRRRFITICFEHTRYRQKNLQALLLCLVDRLFTHIDVIFVANVSIILEF